MHQAEVEFISGTGGVVQGVFTVELGAVFEARIEACPGATAVGGSTGGLKSSWLKKNIEVKLPVH